MTLPAMLPLPSGSSHYLDPVKPTLALPVLQTAFSDLSVGIDVVHIERIRESLDAFAERFLRRLFTPREIAYAQSSPAQQLSRLAARFAAKEAALKALGIAQAGIDWRDLEVVRRTDGSCELAIHGRARSVSEFNDSDDVALSLSHDGDYAVAIVTLRRARSIAPRLTHQFRAKP